MLDYKEKNSQASFIYRCDYVPAQKKLQKPPSRLSSFLSIILTAKKLVHAHAYSYSEDESHEYSYIREDDQDKFNSIKFKCINHAKKQHGVKFISRLFLQKYITSINILTIDTKSGTNTTHN